MASNVRNIKIVKQGSGLSAYYTVLYKQHTSAYDGGKRKDTISQRKFMDEKQARAFCLRHNHPFPDDEE